MSKNKLLSGIVICAIAFMSGHWNQPKFPSLPDVPVFHRILVQFCDLFCQGPGVSFWVTYYILLSLHKENLLLNHTYLYRMCCKVHSSMLLSCLLTKTVMPEGEKDWGCQ